MKDHVDRSRPLILSYKGKTPVIGEGVYLAPGACVIGDVVIGNDSSVWFGTVVRGDEHYIKIGSETNIQDMCVLHVTEGKFPLIVGSRVTIGHGAVVHACTVEDEVLVGIGSVVLDGAIVRKHSVVAAGALVPPGMEVPAGTIVAGVPARVLRELKPEEVESLIMHKYRNYLKVKEDYLSASTSAVDSAS